MAYYAHSTGRPDRSNWEPLSEHLERVAERAAQFGAPLKIAEAARLAGLLHDLGKFNPAFQARLSGSKESVDHSTAGAKAVLDLPGSVNDRLIAYLVAQVIAGHHAGLPDRSSPDDASLEARVRSFDFERLDAQWRTAMPEALPRLWPDFSWKTQDTRRLAFQLAMLGRMIFSCLVDADFKETEHFYSLAGEAKKDRDWPALADCLPDFMTAFDNHIAAFGPPQTDIAKLRAEILGAVRERTVMEPGLFTLNVPTGGGKTLASLGFALEHAKRYGHRRIITAIPFTSIIDQTAAIFRGILGDDTVLEHHSAIEDERSETGSGSSKADSTRAMREKMRLAMEDWAAPVVVTTHVQLFESLFAARTSRSRKLHNIAGSVIILDEAQVLPRKLLAPTVWAIDELARNYGCSVVLCTATQPAFDAEKLKPGHVLGLCLKGRELAPDPVRLAQALRRNRLVHAGEMANEALVDALEAAPQALVIVNSRRHALELYRAAQGRGLDGLVHLTTRQYAAHRRTILTDVRRRLNAGQPCRLIATSLVEAGVDIDFPRVWRAEAGLDQIAQAAGRCNREGKRSAEESLVTVFKALDHKPPREIEDLVGDMGRMMQKHDDLFSPDAIADYFGETYWRLDEKGLDGKDILKDSQLSQGQGIDVAFRTVAGKYRMIEEGMVPVIVARDEAARRAVNDLNIREISSGAISRRLQPYTVQTPRNAFAKLCAAGAVAFVREDLREKQFALLQNGDLYTDEIGLLWD